jgi:maltooligosyltrehalose trehalohydrolase
LRLRREDEVFRAQGLGGLDGAVLGPQALAVRHFADGGNDRLLVVNLGSGFLLTPVTEPLLAPPEARDWAVLWASEDLRYGGQGVAPVVTDQGWRLPGRAALVLKPAKRKEKEPDHG